MNDEQQLVFLAENAWASYYVNFLLFVGLACLIFLPTYYFRKPEEKRRGMVGPWTITWLDFGLFLWLMFASVVVSSLLLSPFGGGGDENSATWRIILGGVSMQGGMILVFGYYVIYKSDLFHDKINARNLPALKALSVGLLLFLAAFPVIVLVGFVWQTILDQLARIGFDLPQDPQDLVYQFTRNIPAIARISLILMATVTAPIVEELVFRGAIYRFLKHRMNPALAVLVSAFLFASIHFNLISFPSLIVLGIFLCLAYEMTGNLKAPIFLHAIFNINSLVLISNINPAPDGGYGEPAVVLLFFYLIL